MTDRDGELLAFAVDVARQAGDLLLRHLPLRRWRGEGVSAKAGRELVSSVDRAAEDLIVSAVRARYPGHGVVAEEGGTIAAAEAADGYRWIVDPLDGTGNFLHGHPFFAVSIAVEQLRPAAAAAEAPQIVAAAICAPRLDEIFFAARGEGAFLNTRAVRLAASPTAELSDALVATGFAYDRARYPNYDNFARVAEQTRGINRCGAAAIDLAYVAAGRYDAFWELGLRAHDVAAGALLVAEAGGRVSDFAGGSSWLDGANILATNGRLHEPVRALLDPVARSAPGERRS
ncbi:MAG: inositol monophosphatase [Deltaproteobacteria bacterium]|nr:inositol monophosphatase [Deltaproteobacteria bacterium]